MLRNLQITQSYYDLSIAVGRRLGQRDASWPLFAVWASRSAGRFIRGQWLRDALGPLTPVVPTHRPGFDALVRQVRRGATAGNTLVYTEIAPLFATLVELLDSPPTQRPARLRQALAALRPEPVEAGGQQALREALRLMVEAADLPVGPERAQWILLANLRIGAHEQYRLQTAIRSALDAVWAFDPEPGILWRRGRDRLGPWLRQHLTRWMVRLGLPEASLPVGRDVPALPDGTMFPADLERVTSAELRTLLDRFDRTPHTTRGSAASDWGDYGDRMNYIVDLFRSRQQSPALWTAPFDPQQARTIRSGSIPAGPG